MRRNHLLLSIFYPSLNPPAGGADLSEPIPERFSRRRFSQTVKRTTKHRAQRNSLLYGTDGYASRGQYGLIHPGRASTMELI
jgi:hypothetical protein